MTIPLVEVLDHEAFGRMVAGWAGKPEDRPATLGELKALCHDILAVPDHLTELRFVDVDLRTLVIRVPNGEMVREAVARFEAMQDPRDYPLPEFYAGREGPDGPTALEILYSRIADYTIGQCA